MKLYSTLPDLSSPATESIHLSSQRVCAIGNFDGVHLGHQAVIAEARHQADKYDLPCAVLTFEPHPRQFFKPDQAPFRLTDATSKARLLRSLGVDEIFQIPFTLDWAQLSAQDFVQKILIDHLQAAHIAVGYNFHFGHNRSGSPESLSQQLKQYNRDVSVTQALHHHQAVISSTRIREAMSAGHLSEAIELLGHIPEIQGIVQHGDKRGRTIGFPTANLRLSNCHIPKFGVYAVKVCLDNDPDKDWQGPWLPAVANIGMRPTVDGQDLRLEVHLIDWEGDLYDRPIRVSLHHFIRPEQKFDGLDALVAQIRQDCDQATEFLQTCLDPAAPQK